MSVPFRTATATASFRNVTEDRLAVHHVLGGLVLAVADGAGGIPGGGRAADLVLAHVASALALDGFDAFDRGAWASVLHAADLAIEQNPAAGETTAVVVALANSGAVVGCSCGDSGALIVRHDGSVDDLTARQKRKKRLGSGEAAPIGFERDTLAGTLVVASDGLLGYARPETVADAVASEASLDSAALELLDRVRLPAGGWMDDVAMALARMD